MFYVRLKSDEYTVLKLGVEFQSVLENVSSVVLTCKANMKGQWSETDKTEFHIPPKIRQQPQTNQQT